MLQGSPPVDFNSSEDIIDIGAYEYTDETIDYHSACNHT
ncbi:MAG: hypothetical protein CM15mP121_2030 [Bacteroidota bacterium]|nr:MAG: hypothetical protein CM15mP121_2030 [Bacteroidota bacterium]